MKPDGPDFYKDMLDHVGDGVYFVDRNRQILFWNQGASELTGYSATEVTGHHCQDNLLQHVDEAGRDLCRRGCPLAACMGDGRAREAIVFLQHKDGRRVPVSIRATPMRDDTGKIVGAVETFSNDVSQAEARAAAEEMRRLAYLDSMTQLPNRRYVELTIEAAISEFVRRRRPFGVLLLDLNQLKRINDAYGHACGDRALRSAAEALTASFRPADTVGRWGGDEFVAVVHNVQQRSLQALARRCAHKVAQTAVSDGRGGEISLCISVGATLVQSGDTPHGIVNRADELMYRSKARARAAAD